MPREIWQTREAKDTELQSLSSSSSPGCLVGLLTGLWPTLVGRGLEGPQNPAIADWGEGALGTEPGPTHSRSC